MSRLRTDLDGLPELPGVYLMKDSAGEVLYVGKAVDLKARVRQYFQRGETGDGRFHVAFLVPRIQDVEVQVTATEREALILENTLIKKFQPRYNVKLKDDKTWLSLRLPVSDPWPRVTLVRRWRDDGARYFGPYLDEVNARQVLKLLTRTVPLRTCSDSVFKAHSQRPCIEHQMGRCAGPCAGLIDRDGYEGLVDEAKLLLEGRSKELVGRLTARMTEEAAALRYEAAGRVRDNIRLVEKIGERQDAQAPGSKDRDVFGLFREGELAAVALVPMRDGRMQDVRAFAFRGLAEEDGELLGRLISQLYSATVKPPPEILVPCAVDDAALRAELLSEIAGRKVALRHPQRGEGRRLVEIAQSNALVRFQAAHSKAERAEAALAALKKALRLPKLPRSVECYDNSNIQGTDPVGSMVTFRDGRPWKAGYRIFRIKTVVGADDYATMKEVLGRRFQRALDGAEGWELPDLLVIDGGRGQLSMVVAACEELGVRVIGPDGAPMGEGDGPTLRLISIAKPREGEATDKIYEPGRANPVPLRADSPGLHLLQQARDEAHRFGVHHHRKQRKKRTLTSELDAVPGVGAVLRGRLLRHFGSVTRLKAADLEAIAAVEGVGPARARRILEGLGG
jgi:excinuclease ABC subunit C